MPMLKDLAHESRLRRIVDLRGLLLHPSQWSRPAGPARSSVPARRVWCRGSDVGFHDCEKSLKQIGCLEKHFTGFSVPYPGFFSHDHREIKCKFKTCSNQAIKIVVSLLCQIS